MAPRRDGVEALLDDVDQRRTDERWDVAICLTDLPLHADRLPLVAQTSARRRVAVVSLPALGLRQVQGVRAVVPDLVGRLLTDASDERVPPADWAPAEMAHRHAAVRRMIGDGDAGELRYVASRLIGRARLVAGMVRANRPGRALLGLSKLLVGAFGTAAVGLANSSVWQLGEGLDGFRLTVIMLIGPSVLEKALQRPVDVTDYLTLAWLISSLATVGGAIGSGLEDEETVRAAAYGYHPEPDGWRDEKNE